MRFRPALSRESRFVSRWTLSLARHEHITRTCHSEVDVVDYLPLVLRKRWHSVKLPRLLTGTREQWASEAE